MKHLSERINEELNESQKVDEVAIIPVVPPHISPSGPPWFRLAINILWIIAVCEITFYGMTQSGPENDYNWWQCVKANGFVTGTMYWIICLIGGGCKLLEEIRDDYQFKKFKQTLEKDSDFQAWINQPKRKRTLKTLKPIINKHKDEMKQYEYLLRRTWEFLKEENNKDTLKKIEAVAEVELDD